MGKASKGNKPELTPAQKLQEKKDAFARVATGRVNKAIKAINLVSLCASNNYSYTPEQGRAVVQAVKAATEQLEKAFSGEVVAGGGFSLP